MLVFSCGYAVEDLDPVQLKPQWWEQFKTTTGTTQEKAAQLIKKIEDIIPTMTDSQKVETNELLQRIKLNFVSLQKTENAPPLFVPAPTPAAESYPLDEVLEIARKAQSDALLLKNLKDERLDKLSQIDALQAQMDKLAKIYFKSNEFNEERFVLGLKIINYQITLAIANDDLKRIENGIIGYEAYLKRLNDEVDLAVKRLVATPDDLAQVTERRDAALRAWETAVQNLKQKEAEHISLLASFESETGSTSGQLHDQQMIQSFLTEMLAHETYIALELKTALIGFLVNPKAEELKDISKKSKEWGRSLSDISRRSTNFAKSAERQIQRTGQLLSLSSNENKDAANRDTQQQTILVAQNNLLAVQKIQSSIDDAQFMQEQLDSRITSQVGGSRRLTQIIGGYFSSIWETITDWIDTPLFHIGAKPIQLSSLLQVLLILIFTFWGSGKLIEWINHLAISKKRVEKALLYRITRLAYYFLLTLGLIFALTTVGFDLSSFLLIAGALGVGLGFGLQTIFNNFMSGLILLFESNIKVGDFIEIASGVRGEVKEINVRSTIISSNDGLDVIVPNFEMVSSRVTNWTLAHPYRQVRIPFSVAYGSDKDLVRKVIVDGTTKISETLIKPGFSDPSVLMTAFGNNGIEFVLIVWVNEKYSKRPAASLSDYLWMIDNTLKEHSIEIPFPRTDVRML